MNGERGFHPLESRAAISRRSPGLRRVLVTRFSTSPLLSELDLKLRLGSSFATLFIA